MELSPGSCIGHFEIVGLVGAGGMGEVYRARDTRLGRDVALKILPAALADDAERLARFRREATTLAAIDHPDIVTVYSVEEVPVSPGPASAAGSGLGAPVHFLTMQLVEGSPLQGSIPAGGFPLDRLLDIAIGLTEAVAAAHDKGMT